MSFKINENNPIHPLLSAVTAVGEEVGVKVKALVCPDTIAAAEPAEVHNECPMWALGINYLISVGVFLWKAGEDLFNGLVNYIMNTFVCLTGGKPNYQNVDLEALTATHNYKVNREKMSQEPNDRSISATDLRDIYGIMLRVTDNDRAKADGDKLRDILGVYDSLPADQKLEKYEVSSTDIDGAKHTKTIVVRTQLLAYIDYIEKGLEERETYTLKIEQRRAQGEVIPKDDKELQTYLKTAEYPEMERMMMHITYHIADQPAAKVCEALTKICDAWEGCGPHKYKGLKRAYEKVIGGTLDEKFLQWLKDFKRELILQRYQGEQMHVENHAAHQLVDWGIGPDKAEANDPYEMIGGCGLSGLNYRYTLNQECTPARIVQVLKTNLDMEDPDEIMSYLHKVGAQNAALLPEDWDGDECWEINPELSKPAQPACEVMRPSQALRTMLLRHRFEFSRIDENATVDNLEMHVIWEKDTTAQKQVQQPDAADLDDPDAILKARAEALKARAEVLKPRYVFPEWFQTFLDENPDALPKGLQTTARFWEKDDEKSKGAQAAKEVRRPNYKLVAWLAHHTGFLTPSVTIL